nr:hypothetical protein [Tanacetum cinerariifolium]
MHNNIMVAGSRDRLLLLAMGRYALWQLGFLRYIDTRPNGDALTKSILEGPYTLSTIIIPAVPATYDSSEVLERTVVETILNMPPEKKEHYQSKKEAIHLLLTKIGDEIYSTVDACKIAHDMRIAIKRLQQGESLHIQDVKTNLFWEFGIFTSHDGESMESYYFRFYKMMNEMIRNNLTVATMQVNLQFLQQLQPEWSRFVTNVKQHHDLDTVSYHKLLRYKNDNQTGKFGNQRIVTVVEAKETVGSQVDNNVIPNSPDMCDNDIQTDQNIEECDDEHFALANLITNLTLDTEENKKILKQLKKTNVSLSQELKECKSNLKESNTTRDSYLIALQRGLSKPVTTQILPQTTRQAVRNTNLIKPIMYQIDTRITQTRAPQLSQTSRNTDPRVSTSTRVIHRINVSRASLKSTQIKDKVVPNNSQVKFKKTKVEDHHRISSISNKIKSVTTCNDSLKSKTSNVNVVCATYGKCVFNLNHDACVSKFLNEMNARTKKPKVVPISTRKPKSQANKSVATPPKKTVASDSNI